MRLKKQVIAASIAAITVIAASPAFGGFAVVADGTKAQSVAQAQKPATFGDYTILERDAPSPAAPAPAVQQPRAATMTPAPAAPVASVSAPAPVAAPVPSPARIQRADLQVRTPVANDVREMRVNNEARRLEAESDEIESQIVELRAQLSLVRKQLELMRKEPRKVSFVRTSAEVSRKIDELEQQIADTGRALLTVGFGSRSTKFEPSEREGRDLLAAAKLASRVNVVGHTDNVGSPERNRVVAMTRAVSAKNYMTDRGVAARKIAVASRGDTEPVGDNQTEEGRAQNRRVEIEFKR